MKISLLKYVAIIILFISVKKELLAQSQSDDCYIYNAALEHLEEEQKSIKYYFLENPDPETGDFGPEYEYKQLLRYDFSIICNSKMDLDSTHISRWFARNFEDSMLSNIVYSNKNDDKSINCPFNKELKLKYVLKDSILYSKKPSYVEIVNQREVLFTPIRVEFSNIVYTQDNRAMLMLYLENGSINGIHNRFIYYLVLKKNDNKWLLDDIFIDHI